jgi:anti-anti-sigma regulatory factor
MRDEPARCSDDQFVVSQQRTGSRLAVTLSGRLDLDCVEDLAACADRMCRSAVRAAVFDVAALTAVDEAGARTLAATFRCLAAHGVVARVRGVGDELQAMLDRLGLTLSLPSARPAAMTDVGRAETGATLPSADLVSLGVARQAAAAGLGVGYAGRGDGGHDLAELAGLLRADAVKQRPPDLLDV